MKLIATAILFLFALVHCSFGLEHQSSRSRMLLSPEEVESETEHLFVNSAGFKATQKLEGKRDLKGKGGGKGGSKAPKGCKGKGSGKGMKGMKGSKCAVPTFAPTTIAPTTGPTVA
jgi:hypothetical protein